MKKEWKQLKIKFEFEGGNLKDLIYGFPGTKIPTKLNAYLRGLNYKSSEVWPLYQHMDKYRHWDNEFYINLFSSNNDVINIIEEKIKELSSIVENKCYEL